MPTKPRGPFCQSCGMPLRNAEDFGTGAQGFRINEYCRYCFTDGAFTEPHLTMPQMIDRCVQVMTRRGLMPKPHALALMTEIIPNLKRWRVREVSPVP
jgi:hypothetical protein